MTDYAHGYTSRPRRQDSQVYSMQSTPIHTPVNTSTPRSMHPFDEPLPSPASTVASLTRELEDTLQTLDLQAAMRGHYVVKPQVNITDRSIRQVPKLINQFAVAFCCVETNWIAEHDSDSFKLVNWRAVVNKDMCSNLQTKRVCDYLINIYFVDFWVFLKQICLFVKLRG